MSLLFLPSTVLDVPLSWLPEPVTVLDPSFLPVFLLASTEFQLSLLAKILSIADCLSLKVPIVKASGADAVVVVGLVVIVDVIGVEVVAGLIVVEVVVVLIAAGAATVLVAIVGAAVVLTVVIVVAIG